ncbi:MAG TPA: penicillin acylase family protein, partial [Gemmatimonadaceae bacterium]|nr:penicillin acylase family protein [Gemmatimonadaceae bacterium]
MTDNVRREVLRAQLVRLLGRERAEAIWPTDPRRRLDPAPGLDLAGIDSLALGAAWAAYRGVSFERVEGSNNWVVSGAKTATGKPLLANDPHRALSVPSLRYLAHLVAPGWDVIGAGEPAVPGVAAGHNDRVAFGYTIVGMDQQDLYVEDVRPCDAAAARRYGVAVGSRCYVHRGETRPFETVTDTIRVRGESPRAVELRFTVHGPVVAEDTARRRAFALRFVGAEPGTAGYMASLSLNRARDWASFREAAARWKLPTENLVYADVDGNIGWVAAGLMPVRRWSGLLPVPGNGRFEWTGFVPAAELPMTFNPPEGFIATANHNILPPGYPRPLNYDWAEPYRAERIAEVLRRGGGFTRADFERLQHDELSLPARTLVPPLLAAAKRRGVATPEVAALGRWDHVMRRDEAAPAVFAVWLSHLARRVTARMAPAADSATGAEVRIDLGVLVRQMSRPDSLLGAAPAAARDSLALLSLDDAARDLASRLGPDRAAWRWGALHVAPFAHPVAAAFDLPAAPRGGDANTVNATGGAGFRQTSGASFREILDLADWDNSVVTSTPGQSGQPGSPHYDDLLALWREGRYFPLVYSRPRVEQETAHVLRLEPAR